MHTDTACPPSTHTHASTQAIQPRRAQRSSAASETAKETTDLAVQRGRRGRRKPGALRGRQPQSKQTEAAAEEEEEEEEEEEADAPANMAYFMQPSRPAAVHKSPGMWAGGRLQGGFREASGGFREASGGFRGLQGGFRGDRSDRCAASCHGHARKSALTGGKHA